MAKKSLKIHHNAFLHISSAKMFIESFNLFFTPIIFTFSYIYAEIAIFFIFQKLWNYPIVSPQKGSSKYYFPFVFMFSQVNRKLESWLDIDIRYSNFHIQEILTNTGENY